MTLKSKECQSIVCVCLDVVKLGLVQDELTSWLLEDGSYVVLMSGVLMI